MDNIKVVCRVRPLNDKEHECCVEVRDNSMVRINHRDYLAQQEQGFFAFDRTFGPDATQANIYNEIAAPLVPQIFDGVNLTILAYGQTSSGKTFTMQGYGDQPGLVPRLVESIFARIEQEARRLEFRVKLSLVEIYMEKIKDVLTASTGDLRIRQSKTRGLYVEGATQVYVCSKEQIFQALEKGQANRTVAATNMNELSSRSHLVLTMTLHVSDLDSLSAKSSKVVLVDLAGSQKISKTGAQGRLLQEAKGINKSLSALGNVINALTEGKQSHVPYRDSKLTRLLQESFGGNSRTVLLITCSPALANAPETLSTFRFGLRAKCIKNKPKVNKQYTVEQLLLMLQKAEDKIRTQSKTIFQLEQKLKQKDSAPPFEWSKTVSEQPSESQEESAAQKQNSLVRTRMSLVRLDKSEVVTEPSTSTPAKQNFEPMKFNFMDLVNKLDESSQENYAEEVQQSDHLQQLLAQYEERELSGQVRIDELVRKNERLTEQLEDRLIQLSEIGGETKHYQKLAQGLKGQNSKLLLKLNFYQELCRKFTEERQDMESMLSGITGRPPRIMAVPEEQESIKLTLQLLREENNYFKSAIEQKDKTINRLEKLVKAEDQGIVEELKRLREENQFLSVLRAERTKLEDERHKLAAEKEVLLQRKKQTAQKLQRLQSLYQEQYSKRVHYEKIQKDGDMKNAAKILGLQKMTRELNSRVASLQLQVELGVVRGKELEELVVQLRERVRVLEQQKAPGPQLRRMVRVISKLNEQP